MYSVERCGLSFSFLTFSHIKITSPFAFLFDQNNKINKQKLLRSVVHKTKIKFIGSKQKGKSEEEKAEHEPPRSREKFFGSLNKV